MLLRLRRRKTSTYQDPDLSGLLEEEQKRHAYLKHLGVAPGGATLTFNDTNQTDLTTLVNSFTGSAPGLRPRGDYFYY